MRTVSEKTNEELKVEIKEQLRVERLKKAENIRLQQLRAEVEVEELWNLYDPQEKYRENLNRWLNEWCNGNYESYLNDIEKFRAPSISVQCQHSPDLYERHCEPYSIYGYRSKSDAKDSKKAGIITVSCIVGIVAIFMIVLLCLV